MIGSWIDVNRVICPEPGPRDVVVVTLVDGKRVSVLPVFEFEKVREIASDFARRLSLPVKVLPMTGSEFMGFLGLAAADFPSSPETDAKDRELAIHTCCEVLRDCNDGSVRREAFDMLVAMGRGA